VLKCAQTPEGQTIQFKYKLFDVIGNYIEYLNNRRKEKPVSQVELDKARLEKVKSQTETIVLRNLVIKGELLFGRDVDQAMAEVLTAVRTRLLAYPAYVGRLILGKDDLDEVIRILLEKMEETLKSLVQPTREEIMLRNKKLSNFVDIMNENEIEDDDRPGRPSKETMAELGV
jgi:hypothetical protein